MAVIDDLKAAKASIAAELAAISIAPKASYSIDGQAVNWVEYHDSLVRRIESINKLIQAEEPWLLVSGVL